MANKIQIKRSAVPGRVPTVENIDLGELAINTFDGKLFLKKDDGTESIIEVGAAGDTSNFIEAGDPVSLLDTSELAVNWIDVNDTLDPPAYNEGRLFYDQNQHTLCYYNEVTDVIVNIGEEVMFKVRNNSGALIPAGSPVTVDSAFGNVPTIRLAQADTSLNASLMGVTAHDIDNDVDGYVTVMGKVNGVDTSAFNIGDLLYLDQATPGGMTNVRPTEGVTSFIGQVLSQDVAGAIIVRTNSNIIDKISKLDDVDLTGITNGQTLEWSDGTFVAGDAGTGGGSTDLGGLTDVADDVSTVAADGDVLTFNAGAWAPAAPPAGGGGATDLGGLSDVADDVTTTAAEGDVLTFNAGAWTPAAPPAGGGGGSTASKTEWIRIDYTNGGIINTTLGPTFSDGISQVIIETNLDEGNVSISVVFATGKQISPPMSFVYYGYVWLNNQYVKKEVINTGAWTMTPLGAVGDGNVAPNPLPNLVTGFSTGAGYKMGIFNVTMNSTGSAGAGQVPANVKITHAYVIFGW